MSCFGQKVVSIDNNTWALAMQYFCIKQYDRGDMKHKILKGLNIPG